MEFNIERTAKGGFTNAEEYLEVETRYPTERLYVTILFPKGRPCRMAWITEKRSDRVTVLGPEHFNITGDGRQMLTWEMQRPPQHDAYDFTWKW